MKKNKKILILAYFFPPCNMPGANRSYGWAKYLNQYGYRPIIITRRWDTDIKNSIDILKKTGKEVIHEKNELYDVYFLPYKQNIRDKLLVTFGLSRFIFIRKFLTFIELYFQNFTNFVIPYKNIYTFSKQYLEKNKDIDLIIASGAPFILFKFASELSKKFNIPWIADYRDDWNTTDFSFYISPYHFLLKKIEVNNERKWVGTSEIFVSISRYYMEKISKFLNKEGVIIYNGYFEEENFKIRTKQLKNTFTITFIGTLYATQRIEIFLNALKQVILLNQNKIYIRIIFLGLSYDKTQEKRVVDFMKGFENNIIITERISREEIKDYKTNTDLFLYCAHEGIKGVLGSKIFEYIKLRKPVVLCPTDHDELESILNSVGIGYSCDSSENAEFYLQKIINEFIESGEISNSINEERRFFFTRNNQTFILSMLIDRILLERA